MFKVLSDFGFLQVVLAFIAILYTIILSAREYRRTRKDLRYEILCNEPLFRVRDGDESGRITVYFDKEPVANVKVLIIKLINFGAVAIKKEDYEENINIYMGSNAKIFNVDISEECPSGLISNELIDSSAHEIIKIKNILLNGGDYFSLKITGSNFDEKIKVTGRIVDIKEIKKIEKKPLGKKIVEKRWITDAISIVAGLAASYFILKYI